MFTQIFLVNFVQVRSSFVSLLTVFWRIPVYFMLDTISHSV